MQTYTTSEIAARTGVSIPTLRYYERIGVLDPVARASNGHRRYRAARRLHLYHAGTPAGSRSGSPR